MHSEQANAASVCQHNPQPADHSSLSHISRDCLILHTIEHRRQHIRTSQPASAPQRASHRASLLTNAVTITAAAAADAFPAAAPTAPSGTTAPTTTTAAACFAAGQVCCHPHRTLRLQPTHTHSHCPAQGLLPPRYTAAAATAAAAGRISCCVCCVARLLLLLLLRGRERERPCCRRCRRCCRSCCSVASAAPLARAPPGPAPPRCSSSSTGCTEGSACRTAPQTDQLPATASAHPHGHSAAGTPGAATHQADAAEAPPACWAAAT